ASLPALASYPAFDQCPDLKDDDFRAVRIAGKPDTVAEPLKMAFDLVAAPGEDASGKVDVYFVERYGKIRKYDARKNKVLTIGKLSPNMSGNGGVNSDGVIGIAVDPNFKTNHWLYLWYTF